MDKKSRKIVFLFAFLGVLFAGFECQATKVTKEEIDKAINLKDEYSGSASDKKVKILIKRVTNLKKSEERIPAIKNIIDVASENITSQITSKKFSYYHGSVPNCSKILKGSSFFRSGFIIGKT